MLNSTELINLGYTQPEANHLMQRLANSLPTKTITMTVQYERKGKIREDRKGVRHVTVEDTLRLCDERIKNTFNITSVDVGMWLELKNRLAKINQ